jgi:hypothetical protein
LWPVQPAWIGKNNKHLDKYVTYIKWSNFFYLEDNPNSPQRDEVGGASNFLALILQKVSIVSENDDVLPTAHYAAGPDESSVKNTEERAVTAREPLRICLVGD